MIFLTLFASLPLVLWSQARSSRQKTTTFFHGVWPQFPFIFKLETRNLQFFSSIMIFSCVNLYYSSYAHTTLCFEEFLQWRWSCCWLNAHSNALQMEEMPVRMKKKKKTRLREAAVDLACHGPAAVNPSHFSAGLDLSKWRSLCSTNQIDWYTQLVRFPGITKSHHNNEPSAAQNTQQVDGQVGHSNKVDLSVRKNNHLCFNF